MKIPVVGLLCILAISVSGCAALGGGTKVHARDLESDRVYAQAKAVRMLGKPGNSSALPLLSKALHDKESAVRWSAIWAISAIGDKNAVSKLYKCLDDKDRSVREAAVKALAELSDEKEKIAEMFVKMLQHEEYPGTRSVLVEALEKVTGWPVEGITGRNKSTWIGFTLKLTGILTSPKVAVVEDYTGCPVFCKEGDSIKVHSGEYKILHIREDHIIVKKEAIDQDYKLELGEKGMPVEPAQGPD